MKRVLLIYPPWTRNAEPPLGLGLIQGDIRSWEQVYGKTVESRILDLNAIAARRVAESALEDGSHRTHRALLHRENTLTELSGPAGYQHYKTYNKSMQFYADCLSTFSKGQHFRLTPGDFVEKSFTGFDPKSIARMLSAHDHPLLSSVSESLDHTVSSFDPDVVGVSICYKSQLSAGLALAGQIQSENPGIRILIGGSFLGCLSEPSILRIQNSGFTVLLGPGEAAFRSLANIPTDMLTGFGDIDFAGIDFTQYFSPMKTIPFITTRGCYWGQCTFCDECREVFKMDSLNHFNERLTKMIHTYQPEHVHFTDHAIPPSILKHLSQSTRIPGTWSGFVRATRHLTDLSFVEKLAKSGCKMLQIGLETPVPRLLDSMNKGVNAENFSTIVQVLRQAGIRSYVYMLFGYPGQQLKDCETALSFLEKDPPDFLNSAIFRLPPGSPLAKRFLNHDDISCIHDRDPERLYLDFSSEGCPLPELRRWLSQRFNNSNTIRTLTQKTPRYYKSSHAAYIGL